MRQNLIRSSKDSTSSVSISDQSVFKPTNIVSKKYFNEIEKPAWLKTSSEETSVLYKSTLVSNQSPIILKHRSKLGAGA